jgi:hypothetical protein
MDKVYLLNKQYIGTGMIYPIIAIKKLEESKRQYIKDAIEKSCGYFDGDDAIVLDKVVTELLKGESCTIGSNYNGDAVIVKSTDDRAEYLFSIREMEVL